MAAQGLSAFSDASWSNADELIVATEHEGFVQDQLASRIVKRHRNRRLGLTRLQLNTEGAVDDLRQAVQRTPKAQEMRDALTQHADALLAVSGGAPRVADSVAAIATDLRALAAAQNGGWMPTIGRNRFVVFPGSESVVGSASETGFGGGGVPRPVSGGRQWGPPPARGSGPGRGVRVGLLDTGIWPHPWLAGGWRARPSDVLPDSDALGPVAGHATFVAGLILSQAPGATIEVRSVLGENGQGTAWDAAEAIAELGQGSVSVLNLSFCSYTEDGVWPLVLARAVDRVDSDVVVVAAAGNHADGGRRSTSAKSGQLRALAALPSWPAALDDVLAVGALDRDGQPADFSPDRPWVDVAVRGVDLRSTYIPQAGSPGSPRSYGAGWAEWSGTSFSTALVSGAIAAGIDPGRLSGPDVVEDLLTRAPGETLGADLPSGAPRRLALRLAGWARGSKRTPR